MSDFRQLLPLFTPRRYELALNFDEDKTRFDGTVVIAGSLPKAGTEIILHAKGLEIISAEARAGAKILPLRWRQDEHDELAFVAEEDVPAGEITLVIRYRGVITEQMHGIYPSTYTEEGTSYRLLATQFESHHAREAFPCIDEPAAKAVFELTLTGNSGERYVSNTDIAEQSERDGRTTVRFKPTPVMSTYLLAFVAGRLDVREQRSESGILVRLWAQPQLIGNTGFALETSCRVLDFFQTYLDIPYPLDACNLIALPDFSSGAMENWGCITFRETGLVTDEHTGTAGKFWVAEVVAHELAHQWFGNLVTMRWWTDLWLNEGFATWMATYALAELFPDWHVWELFASDEQRRAFYLDALPSSHPVEVPIVNPEEIRTIFDSISYSKGASLIRMLAGYLGEERFRDGLRAYLKEHAYGNTVTTDLWRSFARASGKPVEQLMAGWTGQTGFPLVYVSGEEPARRLQQERFLLGSGRDEKTEWLIPLFDRADRLLDSKEAGLASLELPLDALAQGFYRVRYESSLLEDVRAHYASAGSSPAGRLLFLDTIWELTKAGEYSAREALEATLPFGDERRYAVWEVVSGGVSQLRGVMRDEAVDTVLRGYMKRLIAPTFERLGWDEAETDDYQDTRLRPLVLSWAVWADLGGARKRALELFETKRGELPADIRNIAESAAVRYGDGEVHARLLEEYKKTVSPQERSNLIAALTSTIKPELIDTNLALIRSEHVRPQDVPYWLAYSFGSRHASDAAFAWVRENWDWLEKMFSEDISILAPIPKYAARAVVTPEARKAFTDFFESKRSVALRRSIDQALEAIDVHIAWHERDLESVRSFKPSE